MSSFKPEESSVAAESGPRLTLGALLAIGVLMLAVAVTTVVGLRSANPPAPDPVDELAAMHAAAGVDMNGGGAMPGALPPAIDSVGPVSASFHAEVEGLQARIAEAPDDVDSLERLATVLHDAHRREEAADLYSRVIELDPTRRQSWLDLADCLGGLARWDEVRTVMMRMEVAHPADPTALYNLGIAEINLGNADAARAWWDRAASQTADGAVAAMARAALDRVGAGD